MSDVNRREAVKLAAGLVVGGGVLAAGAARGETAQRPVAPPPPEAGMLEIAKTTPQAMMFVEEITFQIEGDGASRDLLITSARDAAGKSTRVSIPSSAMRIFQADANRDDFTRQGGFYWKFHQTEGKAQFKQPGAVVMIVREKGDTVRCYSLASDERC